MHRFALTVMFALVASGCARNRMILPPGANSTGPVGLTPVDPIQTTINQGKPSATTDPDAQRVSLNVEEPTPAAKPRPRSASAPAPEATLGSDFIPTPPPDPRPDQPKSLVKTVSDGILSRSKQKTAEAVEMVPGTDFQAVPEVGLEPPKPLDLTAAEPTPKPAPAPAVVVPPSKPAPRDDMVPGTDFPALEPTASDEAEASARQQATGPPPVARVADNEAAISSRSNIEPGKPATRIAAKVGNTVITIRELDYAFYSYVKTLGDAAKKMSHDDINQLAAMILERMIDNTMVVQEFRREHKSEKNWKMLSDHIDKTWHEKELPPLLRRYKADNEAALRKTLETSKDSLDDMKDAYKLETMGHELQMMNIVPQVAKPTRPELEAYYLKHRQEYNRPAGIRWREILVEPDAGQPVESARTRAETLQAKIAAGASFADIARAESQGATAAKGGDWGMSVPGGYGVTAVNEVLDRIPVGQVSPLIVGPKGIHIVLVEQRRLAGPAPFVEVQKEMGEKVFQESFLKAREAYLQKLRAVTPITNYLLTPQANGPAAESAKLDPHAEPAAWR